MSKGTKKGLRSLILKALAVTLAIVMTAGSLPTSAASVANVEVKTKKQLLAEIAKSAASTIVFTTDKELKFTIPASEASSNKKLIVNAPNVTLTNKATFKGVTLNETKTFNEKGTGNSLTVKAENAQINIAKGAEVKKMTVEGSGAQVTVAKGSEVEKMTVATDKIDIDVLGKAKVGDLVCKQKGAEVNLNVEKKAEVNVTLSKKTTLNVTGDKAADVDITSKAKNSTVTASVPVEVSAEKNLKLKLEDGAEGSVVDSKSENVNVKVSGKAADEVTEKVGGETVKEPEKKADTEEKKDDKAKDNSKKDDAKKDEEKKEDSPASTGTGGGSTSGVSTGSTDGPTTVVNKAQDEAEAKILAAKEGSAEVYLYDNLTLTRDLVIPNGVFLNLGGFERDPITIDTNGFHIIFEAGSRYDSYINFWNDSTLKLKDASDLVIDLKQEEFFTVEFSLCGGSSIQSGTAIIKILGHPTAYNSAHFTLTKQLSNVEVATGSAVSCVNYSMDLTLVGEKMEITGSKGTEENAFVIPELLGTDKNEVIPEVPEEGKTYRSFYLDINSSIYHKQQEIFFNGSLALVKRPGIVEYINGLLQGKTEEELNALNTYIPEPGLVSATKEYGITTVTIGSTPISLYRDIVVGKDAKLVIPDRGGLPPISPATGAALNLSSGKLSGKILIRDGGSLTIGDSTFGSHNMIWISTWLEPVYEDGVATGSNYKGIYFLVPGEISISNRYGVTVESLNRFADSYGITFLKGTPKTTIKTPNDTLDVSIVNGRFVDPVF